MAVTTTYVQTTLRAAFQVNTIGSGGGDIKSLSNVIALANDGFAVSYANAGGQGYPWLEVFSSINATANSVDPRDAFDPVNLNGAPVLTRLSGGGIAFNWQDTADGRIVTTVTDASGNELLSQHNSGGSSGDVDPEVAGLNSLDRFVRVYETGGTVRFSIIGSNGSIIFDIQVGVASNADPAVAALTDGRFVVVWKEGSLVRAQAYTDSGALSGALLTVADVGAGGAPQVAGTPNGGFAVVFDDADISGTPGIGLRVYDSAGNGGSVARVDFSAAADEKDPDVAVLPNGFIAVSYTHEFAAPSGGDPDGDYDTYVRVFSASGAALESELNADFALGNSPRNETETSIAALSGGKLVATWTDGSDIKATIREVSRTAVGDGAADTITGDTLVDRLTGGGGSDTLDGGAADDQLTGGSGIDTVRGGTGNDVLFVAAGDTGAGETYDGGDGTDILRVTGTADFTGAVLTLLEGLTFETSGGATVTLPGSQIGTGKLSGTVTGNAQVNNLVVNGSTSLADLTFATWTNGIDSVTVNGTSANDQLQGSNQDDTITGGAGMDLVKGGGGNDTLVVNGGDATASESYDGGAGTDVLRVTGTANFTGATLTDIEGLVFATSASSTVTLQGSQIGSGKFAGAVTGDGHSNRFIVNAASGVDLSVVNFASWTDGADIIGIIGGALGENLTGSNRNDIINGFAGADLLRGGGGDDTLDGGLGIDTATFSGPRSAYTLTPSSGGVVTVAGPDGTDTVMNVERLSFNDTTLTRQTQFASAAFELAAFGTSTAGGGWTSDNTFPRQLADVDGDGMADIVGFGYAGASVALATGGGHFGATALAIDAFGAANFGGGWQSQNQFPRLLGDVNGDGMADIVGFGYAGANVALATGGGSFAAPFLSLDAFGAANFGGGWQSQDQFPRALGDVNGDGMADIIGFGYAGASVALATGGGHFGTPFLSLDAFGAANFGGGWASQDQFPRMLADVNGDGMADIVGFGYAGANVALATGGGHFAAPFLALDAFGAANFGGGWASQNQFPRALADVNGDGMADIVGFGYAGANVALATGGGNFAAPTLMLAAFGAANFGGGWTSQDEFARELADINGDGAADIAGFGIAGLTVALSQNFFVG